MKLSIIFEEKPERWGLECKSFLTNLCKIISPVYAIDGNQFEIIEGYPSMISNFRASYSSSESFITFFVL